jgi:hypothetical protein
MTLAPIWLDKGDVMMVLPRVSISKCAEVCEHNHHTNTCLTLIKAAFRLPVRPRPDVVVGLLRD